MKPLNLEKALELYTIIGKYLPEKGNEYSEPLDFIGTIVTNINESGNHRDYVNAVSIMSNVPVKELLKLKWDEILNLFFEGLTVNQIVSLKKFCESVNHA